MASTAIDLNNGEKVHSTIPEKGYGKEYNIRDEESPIAPAYDAGRRSSTGEPVEVSFDSTHRKLKPRHIQLIGIGGTIGTALYVQIGRGLLNGGPGSLFLAFTIW